MKARHAALAALLLCAAPARGATARGDVLVLQAAGKPATTSFATIEDATYTVTVTGVYSYNGTLGLGLADCGHKDPEDESGWISVANVQLDGYTAGCAVQAANAEHRYTWEQRGTGKPFTFLMPSSTFTDDDTGCLVITVTESPATVGVNGAPATPGTCWTLA